MFVGGAAIINTGGESLIAIALAHGLVLAAAVCAMIHISGGQFNPAVSIALVLLGRQPPARAIVFIAAQLAGAITAAWLLSLAYSSQETQAVRLGATLGSLSFGENANLSLVLVLEAVATFILMAVIVGTAVDERGPKRTAGVAGFSIGLVVCANILAFGPLTGASMNPCRSFGPALVGGHWDMHWVYWVAPILGASIAAMLWKAVLGGVEPVA